MKKGALDMAKSLIETEYIPDYEKNGKPQNVYRKAAIMFVMIIGLNLFLNFYMQG